MRGVILIVSIHHFDLLLVGVLRGQACHLAKLERHFATHNKQFEKLQVANNLGTITAAALVPVPQPDNRNDLVRCDSENMVS